MNDTRKREIESVAQQLQMVGEFVPAAMLRELLDEVEQHDKDTPVEVIGKLVRLIEDEWGVMEATMIVGEWLDKMESQP
jgi:hypothetical protein